MADLIQINRAEVESVQNTVVRSMETWLSQMRRLDDSVRTLESRNKGEAVTALVNLYMEHAPKIRRELEEFMQSYNSTVKQTCEALFDGDREVANRVNNL